MKRNFIQYLFTIILILIWMPLRAQDVEKLTENGSIELQNGNYEKGVKLLQKAKDLSEKNNQTSSDLYPTILNNLAYGLQGINQFDKSITIYKEALSVYQQMGKEASGEYADVLDNIGTSYYYIGNYDLAAEYIEQSAELRASIFGVTSQEYSLSISNLASIYRRTGQLDKAIIYNKKVLLIREKTVGKLSINYARNLVNLASVYGDMKKYFAAEPLLSQAINVYENQKHTQNQDYLTALFSWGVLKMHLGEYDEARKVHNQNIHQVKKLYGTENLSYTQAISGLIQLENILDNYADVESLILEKITILKSILGSEHYEVAIAFNNLAVFYSKIGSNDKAIQFYKESLSVLRVAIGANHYETVQAEFNLINLLLTTADYDKAGNLLKQLEPKEKNNLLGANSAQFYALYGTYYYNIDQSKEAIVWLDKAQQMYQKSALDGTKAYADLLNTIGVTRMEMGQYEKAASFFNESLKITQESRAMKSASTNTLSNYIQCLISQNKYDEVYEMAKKLEAEILYQIKDIFPILSEQERINFGANLSSSISVYKSAVSIGAIFQPSRSKNLLNFDILTKGMVFNSMKRVEQSVALSKDNKLDKSYRYWKRLKRYYAEIVQNETAPDELIKTKTKVDSLEKVLSAGSLDFRRNVLNNYDWKDIQKGLKPNQAMVDITRASIADTAYVAIILTKDMKYPEVVHLPGGELEVKSIRNYRNAIKFKIQDTRSFDAFWNAIDAKLTDVNRVYFVPDGVYHQVSVKTLYDKVEGKYIIDKYEVVNLTNPADILKGPPGDKGNMNITLIGRPNYQFNSTKNAVSANNVFASQRFVKNGVINDLPGTMAEIIAIGKFCESNGYDVEMIYNNEASEYRINQLSSPMILHIATHGYFLGENEQSILVNNKSGNKSFEYSLIRSGLLLAGCQTSLEQGIKGAEDGILTALEVTNLNLNRTRLTVLSACETGLGDVVNGEGVFGLVRSFRMAGSQSLLLSLWEVNDDATKIMMIEFYKNYLTLDMDRSSALHHAQLSVRQTYDHPNYWGSFVLVE